ncbi:MAG: hypothetical protein IPL46_33945 [Saprospiraceae bacterium]|nr:hypothetical protein [Saprospiraceae bacterium]
MTFGTPCTNDGCEENEAYKITATHLQDLTQNYRKGVVLGGDLLYSILYLEHISKIVSRVNYGDVTVYSDQKDYKEDIKVWRQWLSENQCKIDMDLVRQTKQDLVQSEVWLEINR